MLVLMISTELELQTSIHTPGSSRSDMAGSGCEHNGVIYRNGQSFTPSCKYQCVCVNGAIGCVGLCAESQPPRVWCQTPRRVKVPGQCCEKWICDEPKRGRKTAPRHAIEGKIQLTKEGLEMGCLAEWEGVCRRNWQSGGSGRPPPFPRFCSRSQHASERSCAGNKVLFVLLKQICNYIQISGV